MRLLFVHQNFPGQFRHLAPALVQQGHQVTALAWGTGEPEQWQGVSCHRYSASRGSTAAIHPWVADFETKVIRGEACLRAARRLAEAGYCPDAIIAHPGWGESLFLLDLWPGVPLGLYSEFFYSEAGADVGFDPDFAPADSLLDACRVKLKNINNLLQLPLAAAGISPTHWQAASFPEPFRSRITVVHDGIDTEAIAPNPRIALSVRTADGRQLTLTRQDEVVTFVNRNLEPYRGYHVFMRALPELLRRRPKARVLIVGGNDVSYGARPAEGKTWKDIFISEVRGQVPDEDWARVHFLGHVPHHLFTGLQQLSSVHVYLTYPFVLSWSLLEAMSCGCTIVASDTQPLHEAIRHGHTGRLVSFFDRGALVDEVCALLDNPQERARLGAAARDFARHHYDLKTVCLPGQVRWVEGLAG